MISVNINDAEMQFIDLLKKVEKSGESFWICRDDKPIAELRPIQKKEVDPLRVHPELVCKILYDPTEPLTEDEWPEKFR